MAEALPLQPGDPRRLGEYEITGRLGVGEHGAVFRGRDRSGRTVAVKVLHLRVSGEPAARSRFVDAFAAARKVSGFCTAGVLDADVEGDRPYVVSEWVDGPSLLQLVADEGPRGTAVVERLAVGTAVALAAAHRAGAVHHDLEPGDVLLGRNGPQVSDFGLTQALDAVNAAPTGRIGDDPSYKAPEQLSGVDIGPAADVFGWAAVLLFAANGRPPFGEGSPSEVMQRIMYDDPDITALPFYLRGIVADALSKEPAKRPTAAELLGRLLDGAGPLADRMPESLVAEGRALAGSSAAAAPAAAAPAPPLPPRPEPLPEPAPAAPSVAAAEPVPAASPPASFGAPASPAVLGPRNEWPPQEPSDLTRVDTPRVEDTAFDHDPATQAMPPLAAAPLPDPADRTEPTPHLIPGMGGRGEPDREDERSSTAILSLPPAGGESGFAGLLARLPRPGNHLLGVALSLTIGVLVGVAIIGLVLLPQMRGDDDGAPAGKADGIDDTPVTAVPEAFAGTWKGTLVNSGRGASFPVEVTFEKGTKAGRAVYPRNGCTGTLAFARGTNRQLHMSLTIAKPCTAGDVLVSRQPDGSLQYAWSAPGSAEVGYQGKLSRD
ncbi:serine/threonine protein kinase [Actinomadura sp. 21ATH]|uniref:serine/threonine protein kinase n=1 Tax=Actinomadura sp. 21ATH TaxID=1735444 RepID=UPI0035BF10E8